MRRGSRAAPRGYTVVEVMMALAVLTLSAAGVIAMQKATLIANTNARNLATANGIAQAWMERLRLDAQTWNEQGNVPDITDTRWLQLATAAPPVSGAGWFTPALAGTLGTPIGSPTADVMGADLYAGDTAALVPAFCTQVRLTRFAANQASALSTLYKTVRIEVRVVWDRLGQPITCNALPLDWETQVGHWGSVYLVSAAVENPAPY
jgi:prepilin-type N-terminal cleavage/methylation domain-containing protein